VAIPVAVARHQFITTDALRPDEPFALQFRYPLGTLVFRE